MRKGKYLKSVGNGKETLTITVARVAALYRRLLPGRQTVTGGFEESPHLCVFPLSFEELNVIPVF